MTTKWLFPGVYSMWWVIPLIATAVGLMIWLMRYELRLVPLRVGVTLLGLRLTVLLTLLFVFLQPTIAWVVDRTKSGRIVVAIDLSDSTGTSDQHAAAVEKLRWARALEMIGNKEIDERLDRWLAQLEQGSLVRDLEWVDPNETDDPDRRAALERSRKAAVKELFDEIGAMPRREIALRLLSQTSEPLLESLGEISHVDVVVFSGKQEGADAETFARFVDDPPQSLLTGVSDLRQAFPLEALETDSIRTLGVVVFSDGRDNAGGDVSVLASRLGLANVPVHSVMLGSVYKPKDISIAKLDYPERPSKDEKAIVSATLNTPGFQGEEVVVTLEREGEPPLIERIVVDDDVEKVEFDLDTDEVGRDQYVIRTDVLEGETRDDNNERSFAVNVVDDRVNVFLLEGEARWEFRFLHSALERDKRAEVEKVVYRQPYMGVLPNTFWPRKLSLPADPKDLEGSPFADPDVVIVGDISPLDLPREGWDLLEQFVGEGGGTLVVVAGQRFMPRSYRSETLDALLPVTDLRPLSTEGQGHTGSPTERGFQMRPTPEGEAQEFMRFDRDRDENRRIWNGLPGHLWGLVGEAKPAATVYAFAQQQGEQIGLEDERSNALIAHQFYGNGQVVWIGVDSTWRWRYRAGDKYLHRFWGQLVRWAAENKAAARNDSVQLVLPRGDLEVGEDAVVQARWTRRFMERNKNLRTKANIMVVDDEGNERPFQTIDLEPREGRPLVHEGRAVSLPKGRYVVRLEAENAEEAALGELEAPLYVHDKQTLELSDLSANKKLLQEVAAASNGRLFLPDQAREIPKLFRNPDLDASKRMESELWDHWTVMVVFFLLLTIEWVTRKLHGLP